MANDLFEAPRGGPEYYRVGRGAGRLVTAALTWVISNFYGSPNPDTDPVPQTITITVARGFIGIAGNPALVEELRTKGEQDSD